MPDFQGNRNTPRTDVEVPEATPAVSGASVARYAGGSHLSSPSVQVTREEHADEGGPRREGVSLNLVTRDSCTRPEGRS